MLQGTIQLGLPLQRDPSSGDLTLSDAVVCYHAPGGNSSSDVSGEALVVRAPDTQSDALQLGASCTSEQRAVVTVDCGPTAAPLVVVNPPESGSVGADSLGLDVSVPVRLCASGHCEQGSPDLVPAVVAGRLECSAPPADGTPTAAGAVCLWYGLQVSADGVPVSGLVPSDLDTGSFSGGGWAEAPLAAGAQLVTVSDGCAPNSFDPTGCHTDVSQRWIWADYGPGPIMVFLLPSGETPLLIPAPDPRLAASFCYQSVGAGACPVH